jgi:hypothetical protein
VEGQAGTPAEESKRILWLIDGAPCPVCDGRKWGRFGELGNMRVGLTAVTPEGVAVSFPDETATLLAFPFICRTCGFIRLHSVHALERLVQETKDEAS